ncbi:MAG: hypothetical protein QOJ89_491 [bacterium]
MLASLSLSRPGQALGAPVLKVPGVAALEARQLRLLAHAVGDHLPIELALEVAELEARRCALLAAGALL